LACADDHNSGCAQAGTLARLELTTTTVVARKAAPLPGLS
jgi:hypothetical protein